MTPFTRTRFSWLAYAMTAYYAYLQTAPGPLMPFLRSELGLNYTVAGLHFSAFALGMVLAGLSADRLANKSGRRAVFWGGGSGMAIGALALILANRVGLTVASVLVMGYFGTIMLIIIQAALSDHHGRGRAVALTEANVAASLSATLVPIFIGLFQQAGLGWRAALLPPVLVFVSLALVYRRLPVPEVELSEEPEGGGRRGLPRAFWAFWAALILGVAIEWSLVFWGADYLFAVIGFSKSSAAAVMSVFFLAMVLGRFTGSRLARRYNSMGLLAAALAVAFLGFIVFWLARLPWLNVLALFTAGLGIANMYPLFLAQATGAAPGQADKATARVSFGAGAAMLVAPFTLGAMADQLTIQNAFGVVLVFFFAVALVLAYARRLTAG